MSVNLFRAMAMGSIVFGCMGWAAAAAVGNHPIKPTARDGRPLNLDFETGTLQDWGATGDAFDGQPVRGDTVAARRADMRSQHQGQYWIGGFEVKGDDATGTLTSVPFPVTHRWASFLVAGGPWPETRVELVRADDQKVFYKTSGYENEALRPVVVDLKDLSGKDIFIRLVDQRKGHWGHINFDDFEFYDQRPHFDDELDPNRLATAAPEPPPLDPVPHAGVDPKDAIKIMTMPSGFHLSLFAGEPDIVQPIAFTIDQRGRLWVVEGITYPIRAPEGQGKDRILIFEDTRGTGHFDKRTVFMENLNLVSGIEVGFGGVWIGAAPYLLFVPVNDWDHPKPAAAPQVLLDGFAYHDTHETLNTFCWGPDGWLYGCHGVFNQSMVGRPGTPTNQRMHIDAGIWRYHPVRHVFERFAEGTSNPWGIDFDANGQIIAEACVIPHLWHIIQGAHYQRQAGEHDTPYVYDDIRTIADHLHWAPAKDPWAANGRSNAFGGGHAHAGMLVYQGGSWPREFDGQYFMNNIHGSRINMDMPEAQGSGFVGHHGHDLLVFNDTWARVVNIRSDQDGSAYMIDWYDATHCHTTSPEAVDRGNGRIYKLSYGDTKTTQVNLDKLSDAELVELELPFKKAGAGARVNDWYARTARRLLAERAAGGKFDVTTRRALRDAVEHDSSDKDRLNALWALHVTGGVPDETARRVFAADHPYDVAWTIQLLCENNAPPEWAVKEFARLAKEDQSPVVRLYLASACQRMPIEQTWAIAEGLLGHAEDAHDHNLPLMDWYAFEPLAGHDPARALAIAAQTQLPNILSFTVRRVGAIGNASALDAMTRTLASVGDERRQVEILAGMTDALRGRRSVPMPQGWAAVEQKLSAPDASEGVRSRVAALSVTFGSRPAIEAEQRLLADASADPARRQAAMDALLAIKDPSLPAALQRVLDTPALRGAALRGLAQYDDANTPASILAVYGSFDEPQRKDALHTLASRPAFARTLLAAVASGKVPARDVSADVVRQLRQFHDADLDAQVTKVWGVLRDSPQDKLNRMAQLRKVVESPGPAPDVRRGRLLFTQTCGQCHTLFDAGGHVGPDITGSNRADLTFLLQRVVDPNFLIANEYRPTIVKTTDDRVIIGIVKKEDSSALTLQTPNELVVVPLKEIAVRKLSPLGMMPEGLLDNIKDADVRDLIAYLRSPAQVPVESAK